MYKEKVKLWVHLCKFFTHLKHILKKIFGGMSLSLKIKF